MDNMGARGVQRMLDVRADCQTKAFAEVGEIDDNHLQSYP
jgi:hypothetical protein